MALKLGLNCRLPVSYTHLHINNGENSIISNTKKNLEDLTLDDIMDAVNKEDLLCIELVEEIGVKLGRHVAGLINIFNPELVIICLLYTSYRLR